MSNSEHSATTIRSAGIVSNLLIFLVFVGITFAPLAGDWFGLDEGIALRENRNRTPFPEWSTSRESLETFPRDFEAAYNDHFGFRNWLVSTASELRYDVLGQSPNPDRVLVGREGWHFLNNDPLMNLRRGTGFLKDADLAAVGEELQKRHDWCVERGIKFAYVIAPEQQTIYPEYYPSAYTVVEEPGHTDRFTAYMREHSDVPVLDLREVLFRGKETNRTHHKLDPHWNEFGGFVGTQAIVELLRRWFPVMEPFALDEFDVSTADGPGGVCNTMLGLPEPLMEERFRVHPKEGSNIIDLSHERIPVRGLGDRNRRRPFALGNSKLDGPRVVLFSDSFGEEVLNFLPERVGRLVSVRHVSWDEQLILDEAPDAVLWLTTERALQQLPDALRLRHELDDPATHRSRVPEAVGELRNGSFERWKGNRPVNWDVSHPKSVRRVEGDGTAVELLPAAERGQLVSLEGKLQGLQRRREFDVLTASVRVKCDARRAVTMELNYVNRDGKRATFSRPNTATGEWQTLRITRPLSSQTRTNSIQLRIYRQQSAEGRIEIDDATLEVIR